MRFFVIIFILVMSNLGEIFSQEINIIPKTNYDSVFSEFSGFVYLDSVVVMASRNGFDVNDFIRMVQEDNSFYEAFKNLRFAEYDFDNELIFYNKKKEIKAKYKSTNHQYFKENCRWMVRKSISDNEHFFKPNNEYRFYTAKLYDRLFYTNGRVCNQDTSHILNLDRNQTSRMEKYVLELKKLIFSPGKKTDVPFIGDRMEIFSTKMRKYYNFSITTEYHSDSIPCYVFTAVLKPNLTVSQGNKTVLKYLKTYFAKKTLQIIKREYHLKYSTIAYDFNVKMAILLQKIRAKYYPKTIKYNGTWHVLFKKRESCKFFTRVYNLTN